MKKLTVIKKAASLSPLGINSDLFIKSIKHQRHYLRSQTFNGKEFMTGSLGMDTDKLLSGFSAQHKNFLRTDRSVVMAALTAENLINGCTDTHLSLEKTCISIGSSRGATALWENIHQAYTTESRRIVPLLTSPLTTMAHISTEVAAHLNTRGINIENSTTCSTGIQSVLNAVLWLQSGLCDTAIAGASEAPLTPFTLAQVEALKLYSKEHTQMPYPCMPLAPKKHNTFVLGEAAALILLQLEEPNALRREDTIVIESFGFAFEAPPSMTGIDEEGLIFQKAMSMALNNQLNNRPVDMVLTHMPGTVKGDLAELKALRHLFGNHMPYVFSGKWQSGHTYAASAMLNIEMGMHCIKHNFYPEFPYEIMINNKVPLKKCRKVMINAAGFGGNAASIIISCPSLF